MTLNQSAWRGEIMSLKRNSSAIEMKRGGESKYQAEMAKWLGGVMKLSKLMKMKSSGGG